MTYPMMGNGADGFSRSKANWETLPHYFTMVTGEVYSIRELNLSPAKHGINIIWQEVFSPVGIRKHDNPHMLPHGGTIWGNKFEPVAFRLDKKSRKRRFIRRKKEGAKKA